MTLNELFPDHDLGDLPVAGITADSRQIKPGYVFAALQGVVADGRTYILQALAAGAVAVVGEDLPAIDGAVAIEVLNARLALAQASARFYPIQPDHIIAITGTNGKSSTVDFLRQIWDSAGMKAASMGTLGAIGPNGNIDLGHTTPDPVAIHETLSTLASEGVGHVAMEASSHGLAQYRLDAVNLSAVAFTNLTQDHLDYHKDMDGYRAAKLRLFGDLAPKGCPAVVNADSDERGAFETVAKARGLDLISVGWRGADLKIEELMPRATGQRLFLNWRGEKAAVDLPLIGEFQALNALTAAGLALAGNMDLQAVATGLSKLQPVKGRLEYVGQTADGAGVFVDYAHTPAGLDVLIRAARPHTAGRLVVVFGCGGDRDKGKRPQMGAIAAKHADTVIVTDDNPRSEDPATIRAEILTAVAEGIEIGDRGAAIAQAIAGLQKGDTLLIAGKGHETGQIIGDTVVPFSDQETAIAALKAGGGHV
ncbi:UDP-N-acetylmuramoyl-L-alanyl-D-glutamate--2,6-diaminopimelate ligase [Hyphomonas sp. FCG-A18]|uniref:UDP-N-acetylmuramoyl-L-alanyl-D-glutamate--2, 6-diaminopimelate ligase n=1 Tax=Hyphomonas sp. FCG-A18 TaxID=3080019 RepID=UPI002B325743|nr:UDP-N-acetylmuramoyl-L-alanyl-D-glutamate--2,6-diaminopimelate ligase [Hyphomonas sp. FCG-A18]